VNVGGSITSGWGGRDLAVYNNKLYMVGQFEEVGGVSAEDIAYWDGSQWCSFAGDTLWIGQVETYQNELYVTSNYKINLVDTVKYLAQWIGGNYTDSCGVVGVSEIASNHISIAVYPNPFSASTTFEISGNINEPLEFRLYDQLGREVKRLESITSSRFGLQRDDLASGMYYYRIQGEKLRASGKVIIHD
jgi:hypothetical protein